MFDGFFRRRNLPHWDVADATYFVTACLANSIPARGLKALREFQRQLDSAARPTELSQGEWEARKHKLIFARFDHLLDFESGVTWLKDDRLAKVVADSLLHFDGERYDSLGYVIMPSHFHWVFRPREAWWASVNTTSRKRTPRESIMQSIKGFTARECNRLLAQAGMFWQQESYDHVVRDDDELERIIQYVLNNPVKAGLAERPELWRWSSAYRAIS